MRKADVKRLRLPDDVAYLMASHIKTNVRRLKDPSPAWAPSALSAAAR